MRFRKSVGLVATVLCGGALLAMLAAAGRTREPQPREVTLHGKIVDLQSYMTGKFASDDHVRATQQAIRAGIPSALETEDGLVIIGQGHRGPMRTIMPLAFKDAEVKGTLYEKQGLQYIDVTAVTKMTKPEDEEEEAEQPEGEPGYDPDGPPDE